MEGNPVLVRTSRGIEELQNRSRDLPRTSRHALILVDGRSTLAELERKGSMIPEFAAALRDLVARGLVAPAGAGGARVAPPVAAARPAPPPRDEARVAPTAASAPATGAGVSKAAALAELAVRVLGTKSEKVRRKLAEAGADDEALALAVEASYKLIRLTIDESQAEAFRRAARGILARP